MNAVDLDENPETLYSINITESSVGSVVTIDKETGKIVKSGNMSLNSAQNVQIKVNKLHINFCCKSYTQRFNISDFFFYLAECQVHAK